MVISHTHANVLTSGGDRKISLPGHNRGTIISNGAHAIRPIIMTNRMVGGPLNALKLK